MLLVISCIHFNYFLVVKMKFFADFICYISILPKELGITETLNGKTGLYFSDGKVRILNYPIKSIEQKSVDIKVFYTSIYIFWY